MYCWQVIGRGRAPRKSQSEFCIARVTHNSNALALFGVSFPHLSHLLAGGNYARFTISKKDKGLFVVEECAVPEKIHTHPMEGHWKFLGGGAS